MNICKQTQSRVAVLYQVDWFYRHKAELLCCTK